MVHCQTARRKFLRGLTRSPRSVTALALAASLTLAVPALAGTAPRAGDELPAATAQGALAQVGDWLQQVLGIGGDEPAGPDAPAVGRDGESPSFQSPMGPLIDPNGQAPQGPRPAKGKVDGD